MTKRAVFSVTFLAKLWGAVTAMGLEQSAVEYEAHAHIKELCRTNHASLRQALERLVDGGNLSRRENGRDSLTSVFCSACTAPEGLCLPVVIVPADPFAVAGPRRHVALSMPTDTTPAAVPPTTGRFQPDMYPSRHGSRLVYRDGRVTDLAGNPITGCAA